MLMLVAISLLFSNLIRNRATELLREERMRAETSLVEELSDLLEKFVRKTTELESAVDGAKQYDGDNLAQATYYREVVFAKMGELRELGDAMERKTSAAYWPYPSYGEILFGV